MGSGIASSGTHRYDSTTRILFGSWNGSGGGPPTDAAIAAHAAGRVHLSVRCIRESPASSSPVALPAPSDHSKRARSECSCTACRSHLDTDQVDLGNGLARGEPSPIEEHGHWPGCPAAINAVAHSLPLPVTTVPADVCSPPAVFTGVEPALIQPILMKDQTATAYSPPLFLANCSLLI